jgi:hypothetical protein
MPDRLTITVEANDKASSVLEGLRRKLEDFSKQTESAGLVANDFDARLKTVSQTVEVLGAKVSAFGIDLARTGQTISQTGRDIGKSLGTEMVSSVSGSIAQLTTLMQSWGANAARAFAQGLRSGSGDVSSAAYDISDILAGYLQVHSPTRFGPLSAEDPKLWTQRLIKLLSEGLLSGKDLIENGVSQIGSVLAGLDGYASINGKGILAKIQNLFGSPTISAKFGMNMEKGSVLPFDVLSLKKEFEDYKKAQDYQAFYDTVVKWPASGLDFEGWRKDLASKYQYSDIPKMLAGSQIDAGTGLPVAIADTKWFQAMAPKYSLGQLEQLYGKTFGQSLKNFPAWSDKDKVSATLDWENLSADDFISKYGMSMLKADVWKKISDIGLGSKYDMGMFRDLVPTDPVGGKHAMPETESGKAIKSAWELFGGFANKLTGLKGTQKSFYGGTTLGWTPERISEAMKSLEDVFGFSDGAWNTYNQQRTRMSLDNIAGDEAVRTGRTPLFSEILGLGGNWGTVQFTGELLKNMGLMDFDSALSQTAKFYKDQSVSWRMVELESSPWKMLADPSFRQNNPDATSKLLIDYLQKTMPAQDSSSFFGLQGTGTAFAGNQPGVGAIQINQEFNIDLGDYEGSLSDLVRAIAQSAAIEAQQALLDIVQFRGV